MNLPRLITFLLFAHAAFAQTTPNGQPSSPAKLTCHVDLSMPTPGDIALAKKDYDGALTFFQSQVEKTPASQDAHLGLVRALIGKDRTADALKESATMLAQNPKSAVAEIAAAEATYRAADFETARTHALNSLNDDSCDGRGRAMAASFYYIHAYFASAAASLAFAHKLRPNDELIRRDWIDSLPRKQRLEELTKYLGGANALSDKDRADATSEEDHLKARRPGECRITSKPGSVTIPFAAIYGDRDITYPMAYGLDVGFNGKRRRMQIDTGASGILLSPGAAKGLGLEPEFHLHTGGVGDDGEVGSYLTHVAKIRIGDVEVSDCMVEVLDKSKKTKLDVDGLIGIDVFSRWLVTLNYPDSKLILNPLPPRPGPKEAPALNTTGAEAQQVDDDEVSPRDAITPPQMNDWLHVVRIGHELLLPAAVNKGTVHYIMADTGASETTLSLDFAKQSGKVRQDHDVRFSGISGEVKKVYRIDDANLQFGALRLPPSSFWAFDLTSISHNSGVEVSGFVGLPTLSRLTITIDYRDNLMQMKYDPLNDRPRF